VTRDEAETLSAPAEYRRACDMMDPREVPPEEADADSRLRAFGLRAPGSVVIPVYFHVIRRGTGLSNGDVPSTMINDQLAVLNNAFRNTAFRFQLSSVDRTTNSTFFTAGPGSTAEASMKNALRQGAANALNIYTSSPSGGLLGWTTLPQSYASNPKNDGVVLLYTTLPGGSAAPYNLGANAVHEVGHWLGLRHITSGCSTDTDGISDTTRYSSLASGCPVGRDTCPDLGPDPIHNYMNFTDDVCMSEFTPGQAARMDSQYMLYRTTCTADTTPPDTALTAPSAGAVLSGSATLTATATDASGITQVQFFVGSTLIATDTTAPYSVSWNTASVAPGSYSLTTRAHDAACGNVAISTAVPVTVAASCASTVQLLDNAGFESGAVSWVTSPSGVINNFNLLHLPRTGSFKATLGGSSSTLTSLSQEVLLPSSFCQAELSFWMKIDTLDSLPNDSLTVTVRDTSGAVLVSAAQFSNLEPGFSGYAQVRLTLPLGAYAGSTVRIQLDSQEDGANATSFFIDDTALTLTQ
jgi:hypothetical protein